jgi:hypothetical protein
MEEIELFSRETIIEGIDLVQNIPHAEIDRTLLFFSIEEASPDNQRAKYVRANEIIQYLIKNPDLKGPKGNAILFEIFEYLLSALQQRRIDPNQSCPKFVNSLKSDGFVIEDYKIIKALPETIELPKKKTELFRLLDNYSFENAKGHLEQAISAHARGDWAAANAQLRTFIEDIFDQLANKLTQPGNTLPNSSHAKREFLATINPPFLIPELNEWQVGDKGGFFQGFYKILHPEGSHPGLSDEANCTFRLHLVLVVSHHLLKRLENRLS